MLQMDQTLGCSRIRRKDIYLRDVSLTKQESLGVVSTHFISFRKVESGTETAPTRRTESWSPTGLMIFIATCSYNLCQDELTK